MGRFTRLCLCLAAVFVGVGAYVARGDGPAGDNGKSTTIVGQLVDVCFITSDGAAQGADHIKCSAECLRAGLPAGILPENSQNSDEMLYLLTNPTALAPYAGKIIKVTGTRIDHKHAFDPRQLWVRSGEEWIEVPLAIHAHQQPVASSYAAAAPQQNTGENADAWQAPARAARKVNPVSADAQSMAAGKAVYTQDCLSCHGSAGRGDGPSARDLTKPPAELSNALLWKQTDGALFWKITEGHRPMPTWKSQISETDRWNAVNYIRTFAARPTAATPPVSGVPQSNP
jgi:mono/diheme cytochrome c family protein